MKLIERAKNIFRDSMRQVAFQGDVVAPLRWFLVLIVMVVIRTMMIFGSQGLHDRPIFMVTTVYMQDLFFFMDALLLVWIWLTLFLRVKPEQLSRFMLWGTWLVIIPPIIDLIGYGEIFWSFYLFNDIQGLWMQYYSVFGHLPPAIVYFGSKIVCILAVIAVAIFIFYTTKKIWKAVVGGWVVYSIFFLMGSFPSWIAYSYYFLTEGKSIFSVTIADVAGFIASPVDLFGIKHYSIGWMTMIKMNLFCLLFSIFLILILMRLSGKGKLSMIFSKIFRTGSFYLHMAVFSFGFGILGFGIFPQNLNANFFAWFALGGLLVSIIANLVIDRALLDSDYKMLSREQIILLNIIALGGFFVIGIKFFFLAVAYRALFILYKEKQFGLEKIWLMKYFLEWTSLFITILFGFMLMSQDQSLDKIPLKIGLWLTLGLLAVVSLKNREDEGVQEGGVAIFSSSIKKMALEVFIFLIFMSGYFVMHKSSLFGWALVLGGISFWAIEKEYRRKKILIRLLFGLFLCLGLIIL